MRRAFTISEVLVVIVILAILVGILLPVLSRAKDRSQRAVDISNLRQIGQAQAIYNVDGRATYAIETLVAAGVLSRSVVVSPREDVLGGRVNAIMSNDYRKKSRKIPAPSYPISYLASGEYGPNLEDAISPLCENASRRGWLIDLADVKKFQGNPEPDYGTYHRLLKDGAVVLAQTVKRPVDGGMGFRSQDFFMDIQEPCASASLRP